MDTSIALFEELSRREHACSVAFYTNPDQAAFWASMDPIKELAKANWFPGGFAGREFGFFFSGVLPEDQVQRVLLAVESYPGPEGQTLFVGYFGETSTSLDAHLSLACRRFTLGDEGVVFGEERQCIDCRATGLARVGGSGGAGGEVCRVCGGRGWKAWEGAGGPPQLGERTGARALVRMTNGLDQPAWEQMFPGGDGLEG